ATFRSFKSVRYFAIGSSMSNRPSSHNIMTGHANDRLRHQIDAENGVFQHGRSVPRILQTDGLEISDLSMPHHQDHGAWYAARFDIGTKHLAQTGEAVGGHADLLGLRTAQRIGSGGHRRNTKSSRNDRGANNLRHSHEASAHLTAGLQHHSASL